MVKQNTYLGTWELFLNSFLSIFVPWIFFVLIISSVLYLGYRLSTKDKAIEKGFLIFAFVALGAMMGITTGASKTPVLGTFLPAFLTFISAILGYLFTKDSLVEWRKVIPYSIVGMLSASILNAFVGTAIKDKHQHFTINKDVWLLEKKNMLEIEKQIILEKVKAGKKVIIKKP